MGSAICRRGARLFLGEWSCVFGRGSEMKAVILAGGMGTRLSEETAIRPKPMVEIGEPPVLWHIMKIYSAHGINNFIFCIAYRGNAIKQYLSNYTFTLRH